VAAEQEATPIQTAAAATPAPTTPLSGSGSATVPVQTTAATTAEATTAAATTAAATTAAPTRAAISEGATTDGESAAATTGAGSSKTIYLVMDGSVADFGDDRIAAIQSDIAARLKISTSSIIVTVSAGSVIVSVTLPAVAATTLSTLISSGAVSSLGGVPVRSKSASDQLPTSPPPPSPKWNATASQAPPPGTPVPIEELPRMEESTPMFTPSPLSRSQVAIPPVEARSMFGTFA
jgi:hypothetical protein